MFSLCTCSHNLLRVHRIIGRFGLGGTFKGHLVPPCHGQGHFQLIIRSLHVPFNLASETSMDEVLWATCASAFQPHFKTGLSSSLHLPSFSLKLLNPVSSHYPLSYKSSASHTVKYFLKSSGKFCEPQTFFFSLFPRILKIGCVLCHQEPSCCLTSTAIDFCFPQSVYL